MEELFSTILHKDHLFQNEPLCRHSTFRIGGPADYFVTPKDETELIEVLKLCKQEQIPCMIIGNGSNLLFDDGGFRGCIIQLAEQFSGIEKISEQDNQVTFYAKAGTSLTKTAVYACDHLLTGLEFAAGIPGSVGGGVLMNAGAYGGELSQCVQGTKYLDLEVLKAGCGDCIKTCTGEDQKFSYRHSFFQERATVVLGAYFTLNVTDCRENIANCMKELNARRRDKQPLEYPSAGSVFKRPKGDFAGRLIEASGLKGLRIGDAMVSPKHSGFIVNVGKATASDVLKLMDAVCRKVHEDSGVWLEPEIRIIKEDDGWNL